MRKEVLFSDLPAVFEPASAINTLGDKSHWRTASYKSGKISGNLLSAVGLCRPEDLHFDPKLEGWYRIYVCIPDFVDSELHMKLTKDDGFFRIIPVVGRTDIISRFEESLWRCCDMTGQTITISRQDMNEVNKLRSMLTWLRFVPMEQEEVDAYLAEGVRTDTKRLYVTDDIHNRPVREKMEKLEDWDAVVLPYEHSDAEWLSIEDVSYTTQGSVPTETTDEFAFMSDWDPLVQEYLKTFDARKMLTRVVQKGHEKGLKMSISLRMGLWTLGFPNNHCYFDCPFFLENPQYRTVGREGATLCTLSYAFEEVQQYYIDRWVQLVATGCDAVTLIGHRGGPYLGFEKPVVDRFVEKYGETPYHLPMDDPRLNGVHCEIMTDFFRKLRRALDEASPDRRVQIHLRTLWSVYDTKYYALDCHQLAQEGLIDAVISYPQRYREVVDQAFYENGKIDLEKYRKYIYEDCQPAYVRHNNLNDPCLAPYPGSDGTPKGPDGLKECVEQWMELEHKYGVRVYMEIMPRIMLPEEIKKRALELYEYGANGIGLWDTYDRAPVSAMWTIARNLGHKEELKNLEPDYRMYPIHEIYGNNITRNQPRWGG